MNAFRSLSMPGIILMMSVMVVGAGQTPVRAQDDWPTIGMMETVFGEITDQLPEARWQFEAAAGDRVSVVAQALDGDLDPYVQVIDENGRTLAENDDITFPDHIDSALEGIEIPDDGRYTIRVTRFGFEGGGSAGAFVLSLLPAYADPLVWDDFSGGRSWAASGGDLAALDIDDGRLELAVNASNALVWASPQNGSPLPLRVYLQADIRVENEPDYWEAGLIFRQTSATRYYLFSVSSRGDWAFLARAGASTWLHLQNWAEHPALRALDGQATLGVQMDGDTFTFYVNGSILDTIVDTTHAGPGTFALSAGTVDQQETLPVLRYDNVLAAVPLPVLVNLDEMMGDPLVSWESRDAAPIIEELEAQGIITSGASQVMYVPDSFTTASRPGIQVLPLGQGRRAADFVMGASIIIESESDENGCGFVFRRLGEERYSLFFLDGLGGVGLAGWDLDRFEPFVYELIHDPVAEAARDRVILVAQGDRVSVYVNGEVVFVRPNTPVEGGVGISSLSFDGSFVNCRFIDTWLWTWE